MSAPRYTLSGDGPVLIQRGYDNNTSSLTVWADGVRLSIVSGGTYTLTDDAGNEIHSATPGGGEAAEVGIPDLTGYAFSTKLREKWDVSSTVRALPVFTRDVWLVRSILRPVATIDDLLRRHRDLRDLVEGGDDAINGYGIEAWRSINADLIKRGKRPNLIMESWALQSLHMYRWLALVFDDAATRFSGEDRYSKLAERYQGLADTEWATGLVFEYDSDEDGHGDGAAAGSNVLVLSAGPMGGPRRWAGWR